jgi:hypothetical protein
MRSRSGLYVVIQWAVPDLAPCLYVILEPIISHLVGYKPPLPAFQIGKAVVGKVSARQNICRDVLNEAENNET